MTDRELLERAAKAAGLSGYEYTDGYTQAFHAGSRFYMSMPESHTPWNPLTSDADAFRLAVDLKMDVCFYDGYEEVQAGGDGIMSASVEMYCDDMHAAARRAITRAAAAIGEQK